YIAAGAIFLLGLTPINFFLTFFIGLLLALAGYLLSQTSKEEQVPDMEEEVEAESSSMKTEENIIDLLNVDPVEFEFGYALIPLVDASQGGDLLDRIIMMRKQLALELGFVLPVVRIRDNIQLNPN